MGIDVREETAANGKNFHTGQPVRRHTSPTPSPGSQQWPVVYTALCIPSHQLPVWPPQWGKELAVGPGDVEMITG